MTHFGILCPAAIGHLNPMGAIGRELIGRGHRVMLFGVADVRLKVAAAGLEFAEIGVAAFPLGRIDKMYQQMGVMGNFAGLKSGGLGICPRSPIGRPSILNPPKSASPPWV
jgi:zeaxanthin glucosyltransferase